MLASPTGASSLGRTNGSVNLAGILLVAMRTAVVPVKPDRASGKVTAAPATAPILSTSRRFNDIWVSPQLLLHDRRPFRRSSLRVLERSPGAPAKRARHARKSARAPRPGRRARDER